MTSIDIIPLKSAGHVKLGMTRSEVFQTIGKPTRNLQQKDAYQTNDVFFSLYYDQNDKLEYIEYSGLGNAKILFNGIDIFKTPATDLIDQIVKQTGYQFDPNEKEIPYCYVFPELELSFWRPVVPENEHDEDGKYFMTVGIGA